MKKALIGIGVLAIVYYIWQDNKKKKSLVGVRPIDYEFKDFASVEEPEFVRDGLMPQFGVPRIIKNR